MPTDRDEFEKLYNEYRDRLCRYAYQLCGNEQDAQDIVQKAFIRAYQAYDRYVPRHHIMAWLKRIVYNVAIDDARWEKLRENILGQLPDPGNPDGPRWEEITPSPELTPEEQLMQSERIRCLHAALKQLSPRHQEIAHLRFFDDCSYVEIADRIGMAEGSVKTTVVRIQKKLKKLVEADESSQEDC